MAIDQAYQRRQKDSEGEFYRKIVSQSPRKNFGNGTTQGLYVAAPDGTFLGFSNNRTPERIQRMLDEALKKFRPSKVKAIEKGKADERFNPEPPDKGLVIRVNAKILDGYAPTENRWEKIFQSAISRDNLWVSEREHSQLVAGKIPESFIRRLAKYHLVDNTRGEPPMWNDEEIRAVKVDMKEGVIKGSIDIATKHGDRGYAAELFGMVESDGSRVTRFDLVAVGDFWGEGRYTKGAPKGKFPLGVAFSLADGKDPADLIPPQGSRGWVRGYIDLRR